MMRAGGLTIVALVLLLPGANAGGDGLVRVQAAAPSCADGGYRIYVDCGNGTATDNRTGLVWLKNADCINEGRDWYEAMSFVASLGDQASGGDCGLSDGSQPGEWRLPSAAEWEAMIDDADGGPGDLNCPPDYPTITSDGGLGCWTAGCYTIGSCSFLRVRSSFYWSTTTDLDDVMTAWVVNLDEGTFTAPAKDTRALVWAVRGGQ